MEEKKIIYEIIVEVWNLAKEYGFKKLPDDEWERFIDSGKALRKRFMSNGRNIELLYRDLFLALQNYYQRKNSE